MGYYFSTKNTNYSLVDTENPEISLFSGGQFNNNEVYTPTDMIGEGSSFVAKFTNSESNGKFAGKKIQTSPIESVHLIRQSHDERVARAESVSPNTCSGSSFENSFDKY